MCRSSSTGWSRVYHTPSERSHERSVIACSKLSALFDRAEPKDFVDVYFVVQELLSFDRLVALARQKHIGMDDYWLALALAQAESVRILPRMIKPLALPELKAF